MRDMTTITVRMDEEVLNMLIDLAEDKNKTPSEIVKEAIYHLYEEDFK